LEELGIIPDESIERRLEDLCNAGTVILNDGIEIGKADGIKIGKIKELYSLVADGILTLQQALQRAEVTEAEFFEIAKSK